MSFDLDSAVSAAASIAVQGEALEAKGLPSWEDAQDGVYRIVGNAREKILDKFGKALVSTKKVIGSASALDAGLGIASSIAPYGTLAAGATKALMSIFRQPAARGINLEPNIETIDPGLLQADPLGGGPFDIRPVVAARLIALGPSGVRARDIRAMTVVQRSVEGQAKDRWHSACRDVRAGKSIPRSAARFAAHMPVETLLDSAWLPDLRWARAAMKIIAEGTAIELMQDILWNYGALRVSEYNAVILGRECDGGAAEKNKDVLRASDVVDRKLGRACASVKSYRSETGVAVRSLGERLTACHSEHERHVLTTFCTPKPIAWRNAILALIDPLPTRDPVTGRPRRRPFPARYVASELRLAESAADSSGSTVAQSKTSAYYMNELGGGLNIRRWADGKMWIVRYPLGKIGYPRDGKTFVADGYYGDVAERDRPSTAMKRALVLAATEPSRIRARADEARDADLAAVEAGRTGKVRAALPEPLPVSLWASASYISASASDTLTTLSLLAAAGLGGYALSRYLKRA